MAKATAIAHPIQGLVKYHGLRDVELRIPLHDSISVCVAPYETRTTVEARPDLEEDIIEIDGEAVTGRAFERAQQVLDQLRNQAGTKERVQMRFREQLHLKYWSGGVIIGICGAGGGGKRCLWPVARNA